MIKVKHFQSERTDRLPEWKDVEKFLSDKNKPGFSVLHVTGYPSGLHHNLIVVYLEESPSGKDE